LFFVNNYATLSEATKSAKNKERFMTPGKIDFPEYAHRVYQPGYAGSSESQQLSRAHTDILNNQHLLEVLGDNKEKGRSAAKKRTLNRMNRM